ncbi:YdcF family protein [Collinsella tanakaei]|uniref:YdcF family protein n=1 Tax=Collinsella tanakaei TaxID=626935 RepID=UPI0025A491B4|nr:YdcF family protein [Collinsella tanakaei]MDM8300237.1 YdcF family protein [Collinsella tanakaei]
MIDITKEMILGPVALICLVGLIVAFRMGARVFHRAAVPFALALFLSLVGLTCWGENGFAIPAYSLMLVFPLIAVELLALNGVMLLIRDGHVTALSGAPIAGAFAIAILYTLVPQAVDAANSAVIDAVVNLFALEGLWVSFALTALCLCSLAYRVAGREMVPDRAHPFDFILVHGAALAGARPSPLLMDRLDSAYTLWERQDRQGVIVVSGGQGSDEVASEASVMHSYLRDRGVPEEQLADEDRSTTTRENLELSRTIMDGLATGSPYRVALVSSDFHVFRCLYLARRMGLDAEVMGSATRRDTWLRSIVREFGAVLADNLWTFVPVAAMWVVFVP